MFRLRSCASSTIRVSYSSRSRSRRISVSSMPSVSSLTAVASLTWSRKRTLKPTRWPSGSPISSAIRAARLRAAMRRGWVWPMRPKIPRPRSRQSFGSWVDFPDPVSPQTTTTWWRCSVSPISARRAVTGSCSGKEGDLPAARDAAIAADSRSATWNAGSRSGSSPRRRRQRISRGRSRNRHCAIRSSIESAKEEASPDWPTPRDDPGQPHPSAAGPTRGIPIVKRSVHVGIGPNFAPFPKDKAAQANTVLDHKRLPPKPDQAPDRATREVTAWRKRAHPAESRGEPDA